MSQAPVSVCLLACSLRVAAPARSHSWYPQHLSLVGGCSLLLSPGSSHPLEEGSSPGCVPAALGGTCLFQALSFLLGATYSNFVTYFYYCAHNSSLT